MSKLPKNIHKGYSILLQEVLPKLKNFKEDITKHDKERLVNYQGDFISLYRDAGTHLLLCDSLKNAANWNYKDTKESIKLTHENALLMLEHNKHFLYVNKDGDFKYISAEDVKEYMLQRYENAKSFYEKSFKKMNFEGMTNLIESFMIMYNKRWKSNLIEEWQSDRCSAEARRIRNYYGSDFLKTIKFQMEKEEIKKSLINYYMKDK